MARETKEFSLKETCAGKLASPVKFFPSLLSDFYPKVLKLLQTRQKLISSGNFRCVAV